MVSKGCFVLDKSVAARRKHKMYISACIRISVCTSLFVVWKEIWYGDDGSVYFRQEYIIYLIMEILTHIKNTQLAPSTTTGVTCDTNFVYGRQSFLCAKKKKTNNN